MQAAADAAAESAADGGPRESALVPEDTEANDNEEGKEEEIPTDDPEAEGGEDIE